jgi:hypothetical protein
MKKFMVSTTALIMTISATYCKAGEIDTAIQALDQFLKTNNGGAVVKRDKCPTTSEEIQYLVDYTHKPVDTDTSIVNAFTMLCPDGNSTNQYLILLKGNSGRVIAPELIGDMNFKGDDISIEGDTIFMKGVKWLSNDAHCCPSKEGTLEYNIRTGAHKYKLHKIRN